MMMSASRKAEHTASAGLYFSNSPVTVEKAVTLPTSKMKQNRMPAMPNTWIPVWRLQKPKQQDLTLNCISQVASVDKWNLDLDFKIKCYYFI